MSLALEQEVELFPMTENEQLRARSAKIEKDLGNLRRGLFVRHDSLLQMCLTLIERVDMLEQVVERSGIPTIKPVPIASVMDKKVKKSKSEAKMMSFALESAFL
jgi:hypothetical protein